MMSGVKYPTEKDLILSGNWPYYPVLPMKRVPPGCSDLGAVEFGLMLAGEWHVIYQGNLFFQSPQSIAEIRTYPKLVFADLDAVLAAGWHGD